MKTRLLDFIVCPACQGTLVLQPGARTAPNGEVIEGALPCQGCGRNYPIVRGVPRLLPATLSLDKQKTAEAFGWEWQHFTELHQEYEAQFLDWVWPIQPQDFKNKVVLDAGCGLGRHSYLVAGFGAREVIGIDLSDAVDVAYRHIGGLANAHVIQADIYHPPFRTTGTRQFDFIYSIGVLHHLPDPRGGFMSLTRLLKPDGTIFGWVYGHENNAIVHYGINPVRTFVTAKLSPPVVRALSWPIAVVMQGLVKGVYRPLKGTSIFRFLPSHDYLYSLSAFRFNHNYSIVFDHLVAPTAFYIKREDFASWFADAGLEDVEISWRNQNSWRGRGRRPANAEREGNAAVRVSADAS
jgi:SAM-dependent methyltransferase